MLKRHPLAGRAIRRAYRTVGHALESDGACIRHGCDARLRALHHKSRENDA
jgi:hypothetical protein